MKAYQLSYTPQGGWSAAFPRTDPAKTVVFVFGAPEARAHPEWFAPLHQAYSGATFFGCSGAGEICASSVRDGSLSVAVVEFASTSFALATDSISSPEESLRVGAELGRSLSKPSLRGILVLSDGLLVNGSALIRGLASAVPPETVITGGLAGDGTDFKSTWILRDGLPALKSVSALGIYGDRIRIGHGSQGGWNIFGPEREITRSEGNVLIELDGEPALDLYKRYLGERSAELPSSALLFPLQIRKNLNDRQPLVRTVLSVDHDRKTMTFAGDMPTGWRAQLMRANFDRLVEGASNAALASKANTTEEEAGQTLAIAISCVGRRLVLADRIEEEVEATLDHLPAGTIQVGFYSYGEISPFAVGQSCELHNQTMTITTLAETGDLP